MQSIYVKIYLCKVCDVLSCTKTSTYSLKKLFISLYYLSQIM